MLFGGSEILSPSSCSLGIRNSESFPVLSGGSEILNRLSFSMEGPLEKRKCKNYLFFCTLLHYTAVQIKHRTLLGRIFSFLANRESVHVNFKTNLRFRGYCKNHLWN